MKLRLDESRISLNNRRKILNPLLSISADPIQGKVLSSESKRGVEEDEDGDDEVFNDVI
jgi:hypothetical protein